MSKYEEICKENELNESIEHINKIDSLQKEERLRNSVYLFFNDCQ